MSLFGGLMGDLDEDPFFGGQMRRMNNMMNSMMTDFFGPPFGGMLGHRGSEMVPYDTGRHSREVARRGYDDFGMGLMPMGFGFPNIQSMFGGMANNGNCHSFSSSTVMTMTSGPDGRPQVYQASTSTRQAPGGIKETKKTVADSRTGIKKMSIGHHIGERAHVVGREQNLYTGEQEEHQDFINLDEEEADDFNKEWETKTRSLNGAITYGQRNHHTGGKRHRDSAQLALPPAPSSLSRHSSKSARRNHYPQLLPSASSSHSSSSSEKVEVGKKRRQEDSDNETESVNVNDQPRQKKKAVEKNSEPIVLEDSD